MPAGALLEDAETQARIVAPGDVVCIRSWPNTPPLCRTAALINDAGPAATYALPPNTQLTLEGVQEPPWQAVFHRWRK